MPRSRHSTTDHYYVELRQPFQVAHTILRNSSHSPPGPSAAAGPMRDHVRLDARRSPPRSPQLAPAYTAPPPQPEAAGAAGRNPVGRDSAGYAQAQDRAAAQAGAASATRPAGRDAACAGDPQAGPGQRDRPARHRSPGRGGAGRDRSVGQCPGAARRSLAPAPPLAPRGRRSGRRRHRRAQTLPYVYFRAFQPNDRPSAAGRRGNHLRTAWFAGANRSR
jgi:hypothetical protein